MIYKANILVVDDDVPVCKSIADVLETEGYVVEMAYNGEEALKILEINKFALIILDVMLPDIRGLDLLEKIKARYPDVTVIVTTGYPSIKTAIQSIKLGAFDYMPKPFTLSELRTLVARALERRYIYEEVAIKMQLNEERLVEISIPPGLYGINEHAWAQIHADGNVQFGIHHALARTIQSIASIEFPKKHDHVMQGEVCLKIIDAQGHTYRLWAPLSGEIIGVNEKVKKDYSKLLYDPYKTGWLIVVKPDNLEDELKNIEVLTPVTDSQK
ncbi:MAG: response regulator [Candidatus Omnitrophota bacterium]